MKGTLKVNFKQFDDDEVINTGSLTVYDVDIKNLYEKSDEIEESIMLCFHSRAFEFTHIFTF